eukprot:TRINITY_DN3764_c4_g1_i1.p1 TRINITY_DN3764_c4_g1~~TRINITY_DN3764_c4_g1_i1.p1  ORF type:complete len:125 (-),score=5.01 TRINITY_DN3764_c4_g1_i1:90-464(-)
MELEIFPLPLFHFVMCSANISRFSTNALECNIRRRGKGWERCTPHTFFFFFFFPSFSHINTKQKTKKKKVQIEGLKKKKKATLKYKAEGSHTDENVGFFSLSLFFFHSTFSFFCFPRLCESWFL